LSLALVGLVSIKNRKPFSLGGKHFHHAKFTTWKNTNKNILSLIGKERP
jgi:hypothetical protein